MTMNVLNKVLVFISIAFFMTKVCSEEQRYTYYENDGIFIYYETQEVEAYRKLLPEKFDMPKELLVYTFVSDFYKMDARTDPYKEAAIFILAEYEGRTFWHCIFMPVTSQESRIVGIRRLGLPKTMGSISFERDSPRYEAKVVAEAGYQMSLKLDTQAYQFNISELQSIEKLSAIPKFNLLDGELIQMGRTSKRSIVDLAKILKKKLVLKAGISQLNFEQPINKKPEQVHPLDLLPSKILAAYYLKNSIPFRLNGRPVKL